jgi:spore coat protein SA
MGSSVHIAIVAPEAMPVPPLMGGSVEICIAAIARELAKEHQVTVISRRHPRLPRTEREGGITYVRVGAESPSVYVKNVIRVLRGGSFDVIQVDNRPRCAAAVKTALRHKKVSLFLHSLTFVAPSRLEKHRAAALLAKPDLIVVNSASLQHELTRRYPHLRRRIRKVPLGVDGGRFRPPSTEEKAAAKRKYGADGAFTVLFVGRVIPRKGIPVLLKAMRHVRRLVPNAKVIVAGGGRKGYADRLKRLAKRLGVPATFAGLLPYRSIHRIYRAADCFVCPSQRHEAFGLVNVEAMAAGVPVVASRIGGIGEIVKDGLNGCLVDDYQNPAAFGRAIAQLGIQTELARKLSLQARTDAVAKFGWPATAKKLAALYLHLLRGPLRPNAPAGDAGEAAGGESDPAERADLAAVSGLTGSIDRQEGQQEERREEPANPDRRYVSSKWAKTKALLADASLRAFVPETKRLTAAALKEMMQRHKMVYAKPGVGSFGNGVIRVEWHPRSRTPYRYQYGLEKRRFTALADLSRALLNATKRRRYIVQQGIHLLTHGRKRFDIRVMVQKNREGEWETTGIIGRAADPRKAVTNVHNGGTLVPVETLMEGYMSGARTDLFLQKLHTLGTETGKALEKRYPGLKELGIDVAVDRELRLWILEANTAPDPFIFRRLPDKSVFRKLYGYWKMHRPQKLKPLSRRHGLGPVRARIARLIKLRPSRSVRRTKLFPHERGR